jgi:predicted Zn-dependent protease
MKQGFEQLKAFVSRVREFVERAQLRDDLAQFSCSMESSFEIVSALHSGRRHSKAPAQEGWIFVTQFSGRFSNGSALSLTYTGQSIEEFVRCYREARELSRTLKHQPRIEKHAEYPRVPLVSEELLAILEDPQGTKRVDELALFLDSLAARVEHPRLMSREVRAVLSGNHRVYFDAAGNYADESSTACDISVSYMLTDSIEFHSDSFGRLPNLHDLESVVADASRNLTEHHAHDFQHSAEAAVVLTPKALFTLFAEVVFPNLSARTILDGTGAWGLSDLGNVVLSGVTVRDNPLVEFSPFSRLFDCEGTPASSISVLKEGRLAHPLLTASLLAELLSAEADSRDKYHLTGHAVGSAETSFTNVDIDIEGRMVASFEQLMAEVPLCVVVNNLTGSTVDSLTGQFALDAEGARVYRDGKMAYSTSLTLRGNFFEAVAHAENFVGPKERVLNVLIPSLRTRLLSCVSRKMALEE